MALIPEVNKYETRANVSWFFDNEWPRLLTMADLDYVGLKSVQINDMPSNPSYGNATDEKYSYHAQAKAQVKDVLYSIERMDDPHGEFMRLRYVENLSWLQIEERTGYSVSRGHDIINEAYLMFADHFAGTYDFRVLKKSDNRRTLIGQTSDTGRS